MPIPPNPVWTATLELENSTNERVATFLQFNDGEFWFAVPYMEYAFSDPVYVPLGMRWQATGILEYLAGIAARPDAWRFPYRALSTHGGVYRQALLNRNLSAAQLADVTGYSTDAVREFLRNHLTFGEETIDREGTECPEHPGEYGDH